MVNSNKQQFTVLDLFSGAGGFSLGFHQANYKLIGAVEWDAHAMETHQANFPHSKDILGDITKVSDEEVLANYAGVDVIIGGPSCQGFSNANRSNRYSEEAIQKNKLFFEFLRFVKLLQPQALVMENVPQILTRDGGYARDEIIAYLSDLGYQVSYQVLLASQYGVPENRRRAFFVGVRTGQAFDFSAIPLKEPVTIKDTLSDIYNQDADGPYLTEPQSAYQHYLRQNSNTLTNHELRTHASDKLARIKTVPQGENWRAIPKHLYGNRNFSEKTHANEYRRLHEDEQSGTIVSKLSQIHPIHHREITVREGARIQSFPDNFIFKGPRTKQALQVGNAVPPLLSQAIAQELINYLEPQTKNEE